MSTQTLLIVDDEAAIRDMLRMALEAAGFRCIEAVNIQEAYRRQECLSALHISIWAN